MRSLRINALSLAVLSIGFAAIGGCNPPPDFEPTKCYGTHCTFLYLCRAPAPASIAGYPESLRFCNYDAISKEPGYRTACAEDQQAADDFCFDECMKAGQQNGYTLQETLFLCQNSEAVPELWEENGGQLVCEKPWTEAVPNDYSPAAMCPMAPEGLPPPPVPPEQDLTHIYCHGTSDPTKPASAPADDFNEFQISYWLETWELDEWHYTPSFELFDSNCGYKVYTIAYEGLDLSNDEICQRYCSEVVAARELTEEDPDDPESARILHDNCDSFVAESLCASGPVNPLLGPPVTVPLTVAASLDMGTSYVTTQFRGEITYSKYGCSPSTSSCGFSINSLWLEMDYPVSGVWASATGSVAFSSSDMSLRMIRPAMGDYSVSTNAFVLGALTLPLHLEGAITQGSTGKRQPVDIETTNTGAIAGTVESDGSLTLSGSFAFSSGVTLYFGTPGPR